MVRRFVRIKLFLLALLCAGFIFSPKMRGKLKLHKKSAGKILPQK